MVKKRQQLNLSTQKATIVDHDLPLSTRNIEFRNKFRRIRYNEATKMDMDQQEAGMQSINVRKPCPWAVSASVFFETNPSEPYPNSYQNQIKIVSKAKNHTKTI